MRLALDFIQVHGGRTIPRINFFSSYTHSSHLYNKLATLHFLCIYHQLIHKISDRNQNFLSRDSNTSDSLPISFYLFIFLATFPYLAILCSPALFGTDFSPGLLGSCGTGICSCLFPGLISCFSYSVSSFSMVFSLMLHSLSEKET